MLLDLADRLELPEEALLGAIKLTVTDGRRMLIENHTGILEYDPGRITVCAGRERIRLCGEGLRIRAMNARELLICGSLEFVEWSG